MRYPRKMTSSAMQCKFLLVKIPFLQLFLTSGLWLLIMGGSGADGAPLEIDYRYTGDHGLNLSTVKSGPIFLANLIDKRGCEPTHFCTSSTTEANGFATTTPIAVIITKAIADGFLAGDAQLAAQKNELALEGELVDAQIMSAENSGGNTLRVTFKIKMQLKKTDKIIWQNTLLGKSQPVTPENLGTGVNVAIDKLIENLFYDDYFVMELID